MGTKYPGMGQVGDPPAEVDWTSGAKGTGECPVCHRQGFLWPQHRVTIHGGTAMDIGAPLWRGLAYRNQCDWPVPTEAEVEHAIEDALAREPRD